jgi:hypothetical protein
MANFRERERVPALGNNHLPKAQISRVTLVSNMDTM